jgi:hypothetical protein
LRKTNPLRLHFILFVILSIVAIAQLSWWVIFQVQEGSRIKSLQHEIWNQQISTAHIYLDTVDLTAADKIKWLDSNFPDLQLDEGGRRTTVSSAAEQHLDTLANKRVRMFVSEAAFFSLLVLSGIWFFYWALRKRIELENKTAAILAAAHAGMKYPLSAVENDIEDLLKSGKADPAGENILADISSNVRKISDICENLSLIQMLAISKRKIDLAVTDITETTDLLISKYKNTLSGTVTGVESEIEAGLKSVTSPGQWSKIVLGLLRVAENNSAGNSNIKLYLKRSGDHADARVLFGLNPTERESAGTLEKVESELSIIRELAETIGVKIDVIPGDDSSMSLKAELPLLEE